MKDKKAFIDKAFAEADTDNNGTVSYDEFRAFCIAHKNKNVNVSNHVKVGHSGVSGIEKGERTLETTILTCEISIHKKSEPTSLLSRKNC